MHYFFPCEDTGGGGQGGAGDRSTENLRIQKKHPNFISNGVEKAGVGGAESNGGGTERTTETQN